MLWQVSSFHLMDEVDGFVAVQGLLFCVGVQVLTLGIPGWVGELTWLLAGTVLGILIYNWPPAKIRMGSVGSALLGLLLAFLSVQLWRSGQLPLAACLILLSGFWFNAIYTLCVRMFAADHFSQSRRYHLYWRVAERKGQIWTLVAYAAFGICWLLPLAWLCLIYAQLNILMLVLAVLPMGIAAKFFNADILSPDED
jgi:Fuc2NAc and GlcNAc transferase